jgi:DNA-3-methyladenine glycosylase I
LADNRTRCRWAANAGPLDQRYHDREWGVPVHDDRRLFEFLILEGAQAGLSWSTILRKREAYRKAFVGFDAKRMARFNAQSVKRLLNDPGIVRNRLKINSAIQNAKSALALKDEWGSLDRYLWQFVGGRPMRRIRKSVRSHSPESDAMSAALRAAGFSFVGTTICYAFMQAVGMVNDHAMSCFRWKQVRAMR